ncbi:hypothetical protein [Natrinema marinum]|uniref:hypothetical protein n=1 Tax=Natrinema marinum TaxID=2961598 RepID=UPI0020C8BC5C|nr:hypothetical protein [Natrinema marinum]
MDVAGRETRARAIVALIVGYFAVLAYATIAADPLAATVAEVGFGVIAMAVGATLYDRAEGTRSALVAAAVCLVIGGALSIVAVLADVTAVDSLSSLLVFAGVGCYGYAVLRG